MIRQRRAVSAAFLAFGIMSGSFVPRLPAVKDHLHLTDGQVADALLIAAVGGRMYSSRPRPWLTQRKSNLTILLRCYKTQRQKPTVELIPNEGRGTMIVRSLAQLDGTERDVRGEGWRSRRFLRRDDGVNFSLHLTDVAANSELELEYANHFEANYCIAGEGEVVDVASGTTHQLRPGVMYTLEKHDRHILRAKSNMTLLCVFWPALVGNESHGATGGYPASGE